MPPIAGQRYLSSFPTNRGTPFVRFVFKISSSVPRGLTPPIAGQRFLSSFPTNRGTPFVRFVFKISSSVPRGLMPPIAGQRFLSSFPTNRGTPFVRFVFKISSSRPPWFDAPHRRPTFPQFVPNKSWYSLRGPMSAPRKVCAPESGRNAREKNARAWHLESRPQPERPGMPGIAPEELGRLYREHAPALASVRPAVARGR